MTKFLLALSSSLKEAIQDRAKLEGKTQSDLIREALRLYLLKPRPWACKKKLRDGQTTKSEKL